MKRVGTCVNWKQYKTLPEKEKRDETYYIIGLDIGNDSSCIAFYNIMEGEPEIIDLSGGYGHPTIPTAMQYIVDTKEWVFGEYAILNRGIDREITIKNLIERLGSSEYIDIDNRPMSIVSLLGMYIKELLSSVKNINPNAEIAGIVASVPSYFSVRAREELTRAFKSAGYEKELIGLVSDRECVFAYHYHSPRPQEGAEIGTGAKNLLIDYGAREVRGGVYITEPVKSVRPGLFERLKGKGRNTGITMRSLSSFFDNVIGTQKVQEEVKKLFTNYYVVNSAPHIQIHTPENPDSSLGSNLNNNLDGSVQDQLMAFTYQHKDILFQKAIRNKPAKLYFNFTFPPFQQTVKPEEAEKLIEPFRMGFNQFIHHVLEKNLSEKVTIKDIDVVICIGGGFEMLWVREAVGELFPPDKLHLYKNSKTIAAMGAAVTAAQLLEIAGGQPVSVEDRHQLPVDIGLTVGDNRFVPLAECNSFWWQQHPARLFIVNAPVDGKVPLSIISRSPEGKVKTLSNTQLTGLPERPKGTTRLSVHLKFLSDHEAMATVEDCGFGEIFPKTEYEQKILVKL